jgi:Protein of unknown function (DUF2934)
MVVIGEKYYKHIRFAKCRCDCGSIFFVPSEDVESGTVHSCGHRYAGMDIDRILKYRYPNFPSMREEAIRLKAYYAWEADGHIHGRDVDHWLNAEEDFDYPVYQPTWMLDISMQQESNWL